MAETPERCELPNGEVVFYRDGNHSYWTGYDEQTGKCSGRMAGISTVAKALDHNPDPLVTWGSKLTSEGICELLAPLPPEHMASLIDRGGDYLHSELRDAKLDWRSMRDKRADEGTAVHESIFAALGRGERPNLADLSDEERGYGQAAFRFWADTRPKAIAVEQVVSIPELNVAGRFDLLAKVDGQTILYDAKTSKRDYLSHHVQLGGYAWGCEASGFEAPDRLGIVLLRPDGSYEVVWGVAGQVDFATAYSAYDVAKSLGRAQRAQERGLVAA